MEKETTGTVISVTKQWWLKVNRKPVRTHAMDGAAFPHIIKVKYTIGVKDYTCQKWIGAGNKIPDKGTIFIVSGTIVFKLHNIIRRIQSIQKSIRRAVFPFHWDTDKRRVDILPTFQY